MPIKLIDQKNMITGPAFIHKGISCFHLGLPWHNVTIYNNHEFCSEKAEFCLLSEWLLWLRCFQGALIENHSARGKERRGNNKYLLDLISPLYGLLPLSPLPQLSPVCLTWKSTNKTPKKIEKISPIWCCLWTIYDTQLLRKVIQAYHSFAINVYR